MAQNMLTKVLFLALAIHCSIGAPRHGEPTVDALEVHHNAAVKDQTYTAVLPQVFGSKVVLQNNPIHLKSGYVGMTGFGYPATSVVVLAFLSVVVGAQQARAKRSPIAFLLSPPNPISTGEVIGEHVETFALAQQNAYAAKQVVRPHVETQMITKSVQVPVQTMHTVQIPSVHYQTVQVPVEVRKEIVEVEKPVPIPQLIPVEAPPKPYVKEAVYARPFQVVQNYVKTRITPLKEISSKRTEQPSNTPKPTTENHPTPPKHTLVDFTEENLYYVNRKRKIVTRFIKVEEYYEADMDEEVGVSYSYGQMDGANLDLRITRVFEDDQLILLKNLTTTRKESTYRSPVHVVHEYVNDKLEHSFHVGQPFTLFQGHNASDSHFLRFHSELFAGAKIPSKFGDQVKIVKYVELMHGKQVEVEDRIYALPEGHALFVERRIRALKDTSPFPENIEPVPSFDIMTEDGQRVLALTLTYDSAKSFIYSKNGIAVSETFGNDFESFLDDFKKYATKESLKSNRHKRSIEIVESTPEMMGVVSNSSATKKSISNKTIEVTRENRAPHKQIHFHNKVYTFKKAVAPKGYTPGGFLYRSDDGSEIKVEEEIVSQGKGSPRNEYLRFSQLYVPRQKVKYEVFNSRGQPIESSRLSNYFSGFRR